MIPNKQFKTQSKMKKSVLILAVTLSISAGDAGSTTRVRATTRHALSFVPERQHEETHATIQVQGSCGMCKTRIEKAAKSVKGVSDASWNRETKQLLVHFDAHQTSVEAISKTVAKAGHDTEHGKADDKTYNALPKCCKFRSMKN
jgi:Cu(I)/Ag(I) efflux system membrane fusion protein